MKKQITIPKSKSDHTPVHHFQNETSIEHLDDDEHLDDKENSDQMKKRGNNFPLIQTPSLDWVNQSKSLISFIMPKKFKNLAVIWPTYKGRI